MTEKLTRQQMIDRLRASDPFADEAQFGQIDLSGCPSFFEAELAEKESKKDPFDQKNDYLEVNRSGLRNFLEAADSDDSVIAEVARMPGGSPDLKAEFADRKATQIAVAFKRAAGGRYLSTDDNMDALVKTMAESALGYSNMDSEELVTRLQDAGFWTVDNLLAVFNELFNSGNLPDYPSGTYRPLRSEDWLTISRTAQAGQPIQALVFGLEKALDRNLSIGVAIDSVLNDPALRGLVNGLVLYIWQSINPEFNSQESEPFQSFLSAYAGKNRPWNLPLVTAAWRAYQGQRSAPEVDQTEHESYEPADFDRLSDSELDSLRVAVLRERAKSK
jgi:hypothetical protein